MIYLVIHRDLFWLIYFFVTVEVEFSEVQQARSHTLVLPVVIVNSSRVARCSGSARTGCSDGQKLAHHLLQVSRHWATFLCRQHSNSRI